MRLINTIKASDWGLFFSSLALSIVGIISIYSTKHAGEGGFFIKQSVWLLLGLIAFFIFSSIDYRFFKVHFLPVLLLYFAGVLLLFFVDLFGVQIRGAQSWISVGPINIEPVEVLKVIFILISAKYFSQRHIEMHRLRHIIISGLYLLLPSVLIVRQPDIGSFIILALIWVGILIVSGIKLKHFLILTLLIIALAVYTWGFMLQDYQKSRILTFLNPELDPYGAGYNSIQSLIAVGSGGLWGNGLSQGTQSQLGFLPEAHTDFIYAAIVEELGIVVGVLILIFYGFIFFKMMKIAKRAADNFAKLVTVGVGIMFISQVGLNVGMTLGLLPITGLTLPLVSYGGSSLLLLYISLGIVNSIHINFTESVAIGSVDLTESGDSVT